LPTSFEVNLPAGVKQGTSIPHQMAFLSLVTIMVVAFGLRVWGIGFGLPHRYHIDEPPYVLAALRIAQGDLAIEYPFNSPNLFQFVLAAEYGLLYVGGLVFGLFQSPADVAALYRSDPTIFYVLARGTSALYGTITVWLAYLVGRSLYGAPGGLIAVALLATAFIHVRDSHYAVTDSLVALLTLTCVYLSLRYLSSGRLVSLALAGLTGGAAIGLKILPAPILLASLMAIWFGRQVVPAPRGSNRLLLALSTLIVAAVLGFFIAFPALFVSPALFQLHIAQALGQAGNSLGGLMIDSAPAAVYYVRTLAWGLGIPLLLAVCGGLALAIVQGDHAQRIVAITASAFFVGISLVNTSFARYALPFVPLGVILAAGFTVYISSSLSNLFGGRIPVRVFGVAATLILVALPLVASIRHDYLLTQTDTRTLAKRWIETHLPEGAEIVSQWFGPPLSVAGDPEPGSGRIYNLLRLDPFSSDPMQYSVEYYHSAAERYIVFSSFVTDLEFRDRREDKIRRDFIATVENKAELLAQFDPGPAYRTSHFVFDEMYGPAVDLWMRDRPGPEILIFRLMP